MLLETVNPPIFLNKTRSHPVVPSHFDIADCFKCCSLVNGQRVPSRIRPNLTIQQIRCDHRTRGTSAPINLPAHARLTPRVLFGRCLSRHPRRLLNLSLALPPKPIRLLLSHLLVGQPDVNVVDHLLRIVRITLVVGRQVLLRRPPRRRRHSRHRHRSRRSRRNRRGRWSRDRHPRIHRNRHTLLASTPINLVTRTRHKTRVLSRRCLSRDPRRLPNRLYSLRLSDSRRILSSLLVGHPDVYAVDHRVRIVRITLVVGRQVLLRRPPRRRRHSRHRHRSRRSRRNRRGRWSRDRHPHIHRNHD